MNKITILTSAHHALDVRIFHKQAKSLVKAGYDVTLIAQHDKNETVDGVRIISLPKPRNRLQRMIGLTFRTLCIALKERVNVYHFHDPELLPVGIILKILGKAQVIYDVHEDYPDYIRIKDWIPTIFRIPTSFITDKMEMLTAKVVDAIITADEGVARRFEDKQRTIIVYNFPDLAIFQDKPSTVDNLQSDIIYLGSLSTRHLSFMFSVGLELKRMGCSFQWHILGSFQNLSKYADNKLRHMNLEENFVLIDRIPHPAVVDYIRASKIGISPLPHERKFLKNIPTKLFEYMLCGLPVVASNLPPTSRFVKGKDCALLVEPDNVEDFAKAISFLLTNPNKASEMGKRGKRLVESQYNWNHESKKLLELYNQLLTRR